MLTATTQTDTPLTFQLSEEQSLIQEAVREIAQNEFAPLAAEIDQKHRFPRENWDLMAASDLCGLPFPEEYGGAGMDNVSYAIVVEELAKACATTSVVYSAHVSLCAKPIYIFRHRRAKKTLARTHVPGQKDGRICPI
jgi:butyryl-CoA dehydrogenase